MRCTEIIIVHTFHFFLFQFSLVIHFRPLVHSTLELTFYKFKITTNMCKESGRCERLMGESVNAMSWFTSNSVWHGAEFPYWSIRITLLFLRTFARTATDKISLWVMQFFTLLSAEIDDFHTPVLSFKLQSAKNMPQQSHYQKSADMTLWCIQYEMSEHVFSMNTHVSDSWAWQNCCKKRFWSRQSTLKKVKNLPHM